MKSYKQHLISLLLADRVGPVFVYRALSVLAGINDQSQVIEYYSHRHEELSSALEVLLSCDVAFLVSHGICSVAVAEKVKAALLTVDVAREVDLIEGNDVEVDTCFDAEYPAYLKNIHAPPIILYRQGKPLGAQTQCLAVVGSRAATSYGLECAEELLPSVVRAGWSLVSGGALGIDTIAHKIAIQGNAPTTVVLGSGLLHPYPYSNKALFELIVGRGGTLISPFHMEQRPERGTFPARNRVIAGIAQACLVIEAAAQSGALITAAYALESGRTVCAVPGNITSETSKGCNELLRQGAALILSAEDLLKELGCEVVDDVAPVETQIDLSQRSELVQEREFLRFIGKNARSEEEIAEFLKKTVPEVQVFLFDLQLEGKIQQQFTGLWGLPGR